VIFAIFEVRHCHYYIWLKTGQFLPFI